GWDGGLALNQRYFVPALPVLALLAAAGWQEVVSRGSRTIRAVGTLLLFVVALGGILVGLTAAPQRDEFLLLTVPQFVAVGLGFGLASAYTRWRHAETAVSTFAALALALAVASCLFYDLPRTLERRAASAARGE